MAQHLLNITKALENLSLKSKCIVRPLQNLDKQIITSPPTRNTNFFNTLPADDLWKGITTVSNAGKKRGRAKTVNRKLIKDLNRGQMIGVGRANMMWPGLTAPIIKGKEIVERQKLPEDPEREKKLIELRNKMGVHRSVRLSPIERGWSGSKLPGRSIGCPIGPANEILEGFDTKVLELKTVFNMKGNFGRKRRISALVVTGNGNGIGGFALAKGLEGRTALRKANNRAGQKLIYVKLYKGHTVYHDFFTQFGSTKITVSQRPEGYGLQCHRAIKTICEVIGIKNLYAKVEGSTNVGHILKAFMMGLIRQRTHEEIAEEKKLHLVEFRKENGYYPTVLASPKECRKKDELAKDEILDFEQYCFDGKVIYKKKKLPPFYTKHKSYLMYLKKQERFRNKDELKLNLIAEYGEIRSFLTEKYPEATPYPPKKEETENVEEATN